MSYYIGIDNGVTGSIGITSTGPDFKPKFFYTPVFKEQDYTKKKKRISRIDSVKLKSILAEYKENSSVLCLIERPLVNPRMFTATMSAVRALESTLVILEDLEIPREFIDSKQWQKEMLPNGVKGAKELKQASREIGARLFPQFAPFKKSKDADGILIAEWARRTNR